MKQIIKKKYYVVYKDDKVFPDTFTKISDLSKQRFIENYFTWANWCDLVDEGYMCRKASIEINPN